MIHSLQQLAIFAWFASGLGNLVVRARAGTGKTTTIIEACKHARKGGKILLAAFNKRIKDELVLRLGKLGISNVEAKTLHALGLAYIRQAWRSVRIDDTGQIDTDRAQRVIQAECRAHNLVTDENITVTQTVKKLAGLLKNIAPLSYDVEEVKDIAERFDCTPTEEQERCGWTLERIARCAGKARDAALDLEPDGRISFDDMVFIAVANDFVRGWFELVVVDEAQDLNAAQLILAQRACKRGGRIVVVGDDKQAIYGFRGADSDGIDRLKAELKAEELGLTVTYRCGKAIVSLAQQFVPDFTAYEGNGEGVVDTCAVDALYTQAQAGDFILSRKNAPLMGLCLGFLKRGIKARIEGRDIGKTLRGIVASFKAKSVPHFIERVQAYGVKQAKRTEKVKNEEVRNRKLGEIQDQTEMLLALAEGCASVTEILTRTETLFGDDTGEPRASVVLSSVHKAKGLEADHVFVLADTLNTRNEEEKNIYYVAVTRARKHLTFAKAVVS